MSILIFDPFFGFIELKTGCFIIGYLELIAGIAAMVLTSITLKEGLSLAKAPIIELRDTGNIVVVFSILLLLYLVPLLAFTIGLLVGLHKNKPGYLKAFLVYVIIFIVVSGIYIIANIANRTATPFTVTEQMISLVLNIYFLLVIRIQYNVMKDPPVNRPVAYTL